MRPCLLQQSNSLRECLSVRPLAGPHIKLLLFGVLVLGVTYGRVSFSRHFKNNRFFHLDIQLSMHIVKKDLKTFSSYAMVENVDHYLHRQLCPVHSSRARS